MNRPSQWENDTYTDRRGRIVEARGLHRNMEELAFLLDLAISERDFCTARTEHASGRIIYEVVTDSGVVCYHQPSAGSGDKPVCHQVPTQVTYEEMFNHLDKVRTEPDFGFTGNQFDESYWFSHTPPQEAPDDRPNPSPEPGPDTRFRKYPAR